MGCSGMIPQHFAGRFMRVLGRVVHHVLYALFYAPAESVKA
jgi:hypothetical protein